MSLGERCPRRGSAYWLSVIFSRSGTAALRSWFRPSSEARSKAGTFAVPRRSHAMSPASPGCHLLPERVLWRDMPSPTDRRADASRKIGLRQMRHFTARDHKVRIYAVQVWLTHHMALTFQLSSGELVL